MRVCWSSIWIGKELIQTDRYSVRLIRQHMGKIKLAALGCKPSILEIWNPLFFRCKQPCLIYAPFLWTFSSSLKITLHTLTEIGLQRWTEHFSAIVGNAGFLRMTDSEKRSAPPLTFHCLLLCLKDQRIEKNQTVTNRGWPSTWPPNFYFMVMNNVASYTITLAFIILTLSCQLVHCFFLLN